MIDTICIMHLENRFSHCHWIIPCNTYFPQKVQTIRVFPTYGFLRAQTRQKDPKRTRRFSRIAAPTDFKPHGSPPNTAIRGIVFHVSITVCFCSNTFPVNIEKILVGYGFPKLFGAIFGVPYLKVNGFDN